MSASVSRACLRAIVISVLAAAPVWAQQVPSDSAARTESPRPTWAERLSVSIRYSAFRPSARSEMFVLLDRELAPGSGALRPDLVGGALHLRMTDRWSLQLGVDAGGSTVASTSRVQPASGGGDVRQQSTLDFTAVPSLGVEWRAFRWRGHDDAASDRLRLVFGAGGGVASYRLRQWGDFVDAERRVAFSDEFRSSGRGAFGFASAGVEAPLHRWVAVQGELRHQVGSAAMSDDFAEFDRLDLGGTRFTAGLRIHPAGVGRRR